MLFYLSFPLTFHQKEDDLEFVNEIRSLSPLSLITYDITMNNYIETYYSATFLQKRLLPLCQETNIS